MVLITQLIKLKANGNLMYGYIAIKKMCRSTSLENTIAMARPINIKKYMYTVCFFIES